MTLTLNPSVVGQGTYQHKDKQADRVDCVAGKEGMDDCSTPFMGLSRNQGFLEELPWKKRILLLCDQTWGHAVDGSIVQAPIASL